MLASSNLILTAFYGVDSLSPILRISLRLREAEELLVLKCKMQNPKTESLAGQMLMSLT